MKFFQYKSKLRSLFKFLAILAIPILIYIIFSMKINQVRKTYDLKLDNTIKQQSQYQKQVYIPAKRIKAGSVICQEDIQVQTVHSDMEQKEFMTSADIGSTALVDLQPNLPILRSLLSSNSIETDLREEEYFTFFLSTNLEQHDIIDVRILYPNGENYIVLSKKSIQTLNLPTNQCILHVNEEEILRISSAIIDTYLHPGTILYSSKYVEPSIQAPSIPNYQPREAVIDLMKKDPNILSKAVKGVTASVRRALDQRLDHFYDTHEGLQIEHKKTTEYEEDSSTEEDLEYVN